MCYEVYVYILGIFVFVDDIDMKIDKLNLVEFEDCRGLILVFGYIFYFYLIVKWN